MNKPIGYSTQNRNPLIAAIEMKLAEAGPNEAFERLKERMTGRNATAVETQSIEDTAPNSIQE